MIRTGLILDISNLYFSINDTYPNKRLLITEYTKALEAAGHNLVFRIAYSRQSQNSAQSFMHMLNCHAFETHFGTGPWTVPMALRLTEIIGQIDALVIGSSDEVILPMFQYARKHGKATKCFAVNIPMGMKKLAECIEVPGSLLQEVPNGTAKKPKSLDVPGNVVSDGTQPAS